MSSLRSYLFRLTHATPERKASRAHLKQAKAGDCEAYLALVANYLDLSLVYFGGCLRESPEIRYDRVAQVFTALWRHLRYAERVSDFEYMLASALLENAPNGTITSTEALVTKLRLLAPKNRFAFIAYEFENWHLRWVALLMRIRPRALHRLLSEARCELCGVSWQSLSAEERECLEAISIAMNDSPNLRVNKELCRRVATFPRVSEIKALWLELRPQLVEVRHRYLLEPEDREQLLGNIFKSIQIAPMNQPPLVHRVVNTVHFSRQVKIKVS
ncbi:hypothetical protein QEH59_05620 [Coraliomargarita sp. SDUM461004]|uniref:Uncharacterized protein n=1 Tax=Thalassobacterium sedimentorum TaxID=3041258 RepID=A0ABU1AGD9_9BACT|nr:hypothetical protein [Coraliomargarita sp. SDUM461004]MDQ8193892.1 hypothetical protein [Coraliomargarita sp. SDUM461004]